MFSLFIDIVRKLKCVELLVLMHLFNRRKTDFNIADPLIKEIWTDSDVWPILVVAFLIIIM